MKRKFLAIAMCAAMFMGTLVGCGSVNPNAAQQTSTTAASTAEKGGSVSEKTGEDLNFVIVPKCVHAWFDEVNKGAQLQADTLSKQLGVKVTIDYRAPKTADVAEQNTVLEQAAATKPAGIAIDPVDYKGSKAVIEEIEAQGIPVIIFDAKAPDESGLTSVGNDFAAQAKLGAERLVKLIGGKGKVAVMQGVPSAPNHNERYQAYLEYLKQFPDIKVVDGGIGNDSIEASQSQAAAVLAANPDLSGYLMCDAASPIGISAAVEEAGKVGKVQIVGLENLIDILNLVKKGTIQASSCTRPYVQGSMAVLMMWQKHLGIDIPKVVDTGMDFVDKDNVDQWIKKMQ